MYSHDVSVNNSVAAMLDNANAALERGDTPAARQHYYQAALQLTQQARHQHGKQQAQTLQGVQRLLGTCQSLPPVLPQQAIDGRQPESHQAKSEGFAAVAGMQAEKDLLRAKVITPLQDPEGAKLYQRKPGGGVLLYGPPGTGKTFLVKALAAELKAPFFCIRPTDVLSKYVGESEQKLAAIFEAARQHPLAVVFIDELDSIARNRSDASEAASRLLDQLLIEMEGFSNSGQQLLLIGATNQPWLLDSASTRPGRFGTHIFVGLPDQHARAVLLGMALKNVPQQANIDTHMLAEVTQGYTAAEIAGVCDGVIEAAYIKYSQQQQVVKISQVDIVQQLQKIKPRTTGQQLAQYQAFTKGEPIPREAP